MHVSLVAGATLAVSLMGWVVSAAAAQKAPGKICWNGQPQWNVDLRPGGVAVRANNKGRGTWVGENLIQLRLEGMPPLTINVEGNGIFSAHNDIGSMSGTSCP